MTSSCVIVVQEEYNPENSQHAIRNSEAVLLFFLFLRESHAEVQRWGLDAWWRLINGSMPNLSACERWASLAVLSTLI